MKVIVGISRIFVGVLFIISGFIKLNDPVGFSFKLKDYFAPEVLNLEFLVPYALGLAIFVVILEVLLGITLILGYAKKLTLWLLLGMIVFFTFLTFYSAYFNKVTDCGCFGDALPLTPWESFWKDVVLLVLILILFFGRKYIQPFFTQSFRRVAVLLSLIACCIFGYHVLNHLPSIDFRAYKIGANITDGMTIPEGAPKPIFQYDWKFNVNGEEKIVTTSGDYPTQEGEFIDVVTTKIQDGYEPPVHDFSMERDGEDYTSEFLNTKNLIVVIAYSLGNTEMEGYDTIKAITDKAIENGYKVIGLSASSTEVTEQLTAQEKLNFDFYFCDETTLKTIVRSNPGVLEMQEGTIMQKLHWNDAMDLQLKKVEKKVGGMDLILKAQLDSIAELDQRYRKMMYATDEERKEMGESFGMTPEEYNGDLWNFQSTVDSTNMEFVANIFDSKGYPGKSIVGEKTNTAAWYVLQHNPSFISKYFPLIEKAGEAGEIPFRIVAMMEDRLLTNEDKPQKYGTQGMSYDDARGSFIWPIEDPENVNARRIEAGFDTTIEEYARDLFGEDFEYKVLTMDDIKQ